MASFGGQYAKSERSPNPTIEDNIICLCVKISLEYYLFFGALDITQGFGRTNIISIINCRIKM